MKQWGPKLSACLRQLLLLAFCLGAPIQLLHAGTFSTEPLSNSPKIEITTETFEYIIEIDGEATRPSLLSTSYAQPVQFEKPKRALLAQYGPFQVVSPTSVEMNGTVDSNTPEYFRMMILDHPELVNILMVECPGSIDEEANLQLARMIRDASMNTHVPSAGSVRSGAVELFLAGKKRSADKGAEFAVHSWRDEDGMQAADYAENAAVHKEYLSYYQDMGMARDKAKAFYMLTNSVPFEGVYYLTRNDLSAFQILN